MSLTDHRTGNRRATAAALGPALPAHTPVLLRGGAGLLAVGALAATVANTTHPAREDPMNNPRVFLEYAASGGWVATHVGQFLGYLLAFGGLIALCHVLGSEQPRVAVAARLGLAMAVAGIAVAAVLQGVDGIALKAAVDGWAQASGTQKDAAFSAAEAVRWIEIGINSTFRLIQGATFLLAGLALAAADRLPRWLGWVGMVCGLAVMVRGVTVAFVGFDMSDPIYVATGAVASNFPLTLLNLWTAALAVLMWRRARGWQGA